MPDPLPTNVQYKKFARGAKPTPRHKLAAATPYQPHPTLLAPTQFAVVPPQLSFWGNNVDGDCVTAEEAFAKAAYSVFSGLTELFVPDQEVIAWASAGGYLNGAMLTDVMDSMAKSGFTVNGVTYNDGPYTTVDWTNESVLQSALTQGPVKIGIDADALPQGAGNGNGWYALGGSPNQFNNEDHCVSLTGYGPASWLYEQLGVPLPSGLPGTTLGYLLFTWSSIGFVDHAWIMSTTAEAWLRSPTTVGQTPVPTPTPVPPNPPVPPTPPPLPVSGYNGTLTYANGLLVSASSNKFSVNTIPWSVIFSLVVKYGSIVLPIILADIQAGKTTQEIEADILAALGL